jgi:signal peptidase I
MPPVADGVELPRVPGTLHSFATSAISGLAALLAGSPRHSHNCGLLSNDRIFCVDATDCAIGDDAVAVGCLLLIWILGTALIGPAIYFSRATILGYETFRVASSAMSPTLETGELFVSDSWRYHNHAVMVGEIVVFERPGNPGVKYIKRVVAVTGDSIELRDGVLYRNGREIRESYLHAPMSFGGHSRNIDLTTLGPGLYYVLGDYRDNSLDSRQWGPFPTTSLRGRVQYIWLSHDSDDHVRWDRIGKSLLR